MYFSTSFVNSVAFHPTGTCVAAGGTDNTVKVMVLHFHPNTYHGINMAVKEANI